MLLAKIRKGFSDYLNESKANFREEPSPIETLENVVKEEQKASIFKSLSEKKGPPLLKNEKGSISREEFTDIVWKHHLWLQGNPLGKQAKLSGEYLKNMDLQKVDLAGGIIENTTFDSVNLEKTTFYGANLEGSNFINCNMKDANFDWAGLANVYMEPEEINKIRLNDAFVTESWHRTISIESYVEGFEKEMIEYHNEPRQVEYAYETLSQAYEICKKDYVADINGQQKIAKAMLASGITEENVRKIINEVNYRSHCLLGSEKDINQAVRLAAKELRIENQSIDNERLVSIKNDSTIPEPQKLMKNAHSKDLFNSFAKRELNANHGIWPGNKVIVKKMLEEGISFSRAKASMIHSPEKLNKDNYKDLEYQRKMTHSVTLKK